MIERRTEDMNIATDTDQVFEIMWQWINAEISIPFPSRRIVSEIPITAKIWTHEYNCQKECNKIFRSRIEPAAPYKLILPI